MSTSDPSPPPWGPAHQRAARERARTRAEPWDLVVVGAGITGAGVDRDAALRGLSVLVLEAHDLAYGTSSRSSRLIHGGVRYLEHGEIGLVFEALRERARLCALAPHLVRPARFLFPAYEGDRLRPWRLRVGLSLYGFLNLFRGEGHRALDPEQARAREPLLAEAGLLGAVEYEDAVTDDARLTLTVLQDARRAGADVLTYAKVVSIAWRDGLHRIALSDGTQVSSRAVVAAAGPWTGPQLLGQAGERLLTLSKGIHIVLRSEHLPVARPVVVQAPVQRRILFCVPWGTRTYLGTTDSAYSGDPGESGVTMEDEAELLALVGRVLPRAELRPENIVSAWSGVRPLVRGEGDTVELSRSHRIVESGSGVLAVVGGKLTTYRAMAEQVVDRVIRQIRGSERGRTFGRCVTHERPLVPGEPLSPEELRDPVIGDLAPRHGPFARELAGRCADNPELAGRLAADLPYRVVEVEQAIAAEGCTHVDDLLRRRLPLALTDVRLGGGAAAAVARRLVDAQGGSEADVQRELERYRDLVARETRRTPG